jgi:hypothetical protein
MIGVRKVFSLGAIILGLTVNLGAEPQAMAVSTIEMVDAWATTGVNLEQSFTRLKNVTKISIISSPALR